MHLLADGVEVQTAELTAATGWMYNFTNLPIFSNGKYIRYLVQRETVTGYRTVDSSTTVRYFEIGTTNKYAPDSYRTIFWNYPQTTKVEAVKNWADGDNKDGKRPESIKVHLYANGVETQSADLSAANNWHHTFDSLPTYANGTEIKYTLSEDDVDSYVSHINTAQTTVSGSSQLATDGSGEIRANVTIAQTWNDNNNADGSRPTSMIVKLLAGDTVEQTVELSAANNWQYSFANLPIINSAVRFANYSLSLTDSQGNESTMSIGAITGVGPVAATNSNVLYNSVVNVQHGDVTVTKQWDDDNDADHLRTSSVEAQLYAGDTPVGSAVTLDKDNDWKHVFTNLPLYEYNKAEGKYTAIQYTVKETNTPEGYTASVDNSDPQNIVLTNTHKVKTPEVAPSKPSTSTPNTPEPTPTKPVKT